MTGQGEESVDMAAGGISQEEEKIIQALHVLGIKPTISNPDDMANLMRAFIKEEPHSGRTAEPAATKKTGGDYHYPKLSTFFGDERGDVSWATYRYEVEALMAGKFYTREQILQGIRRSLKGSASDKLRIMGPGADLELILTKLESDYGTVESKEMVMRNFYSCTQGVTESVEAYATRLEELFDKAVRLSAIGRSNKETLKDVLHQGLRKDLKLMTHFQKETAADYDEFKRELRRVEADLKAGDATDSSKKTCKAAVPPDKESKSEMSELYKVVKQLNDRIDTLEKEKEQSYYPFIPRGRGFRGGYRGRGQIGGRGFDTAPSSRGRGYEMQPPPRGRGDFRATRPLGRRTFEPTCYQCNAKGHIQKNCPASNQFICYSCGEPGHMSRNCPNV